MQPHITSTSHFVISHHPSCPDTIVLKSHNHHRRIITQITTDTMSCLLSDPNSARIRPPYGQRASSIKNVAPTDPFSTYMGFPQSSKSLNLLLGSQFPSANILVLSSDPALKNGADAALALNNAMCSVSALANIVLVLWDQRR